MGAPWPVLTPHELFDASPVVHDLDRIIVGSKGNPEFTNLPRKFNITVTGCHGQLHAQRVAGYRACSRKEGRASSGLTCLSAERWAPEDSPSLRR